jgi:osmotically-inducible protein OsmY
VAVVAARLANDIRIDDYLIVVDVDDGKVRLSGTVGSLAEKNRAISEGWVSGVTGIDGNALEIEWWARDSMRRKASFADRDDEELQQAVKDAFLYDPRVLSFRPEVSVADGVVTLSGTVRDLAAKRAAEADARNVVGVWRVKNRIKVRPLDVDDDGIEARLADVFFEDPLLTRWDITIDSMLGVVTLTGTVNTPFEKNRAERLAARVSGVVEVINRLEHQYRWTPRPDWEIRADIEDHLWWSPFVDADDVRVEVDAGVATLSGEVATWGERRAAERNAFEAGAKAVRNELTVNRRLYGPYPTYDVPLPPPFGF